MKIEPRDHVLRLATRVSLDLSKQLAKRNSGPVEEDGFLVGRMFAAVLDGFDSYWAEREHQAAKATKKAAK